MIEIIRVATSEQIRLTADLAAEIWKEHYTPIIGAGQVDYMINNFQSAEAVTRQIDAGELVYFLLYFDRRPAGYFAVQLRSEEVFLSKLYVRAALRRHGIARRALEFVRGIAADNCLKRITLTVNKNNDLALKSYERIGFVRQKAVVTDIGGGFVMDDYILTLQMN